MYQMVLLTQCIGIAVIFIEAWIIFRKWRGVPHSYLLLACVSTLITDVGYYYELRAKSYEAYVTALNISFIGRIWISFALFMFICELTGKRIPRWLRGAMVLFNVAVFISVVTTDATGLFYHSRGFIIYGDFPLMIQKDGPVHKVWDVSLVVYIVIGTTILIREWLKEKNPIIKRRLEMVFLAIVTQSAFLIVYMKRMLFVTTFYDVTMIGFQVSAVFMLIAILKYNLLDTAMLAREYVIDRLSEGIIAVNEKGIVSYYNAPAAKIFPDLLDDPKVAADKIREALDANVPVTVDGRVYSPEKNDLYNGDRIAGAIYSFTDDTDHFRYMAELEEQKRRADDANRAKSAFLANMSHEIRTPINAVLGMDEMILRESGEKQIRSYARDIKTAGRTLLSLINDILDFSKIEEGRMEITPTQYDLSSVVNDLVNMIRSRAEKKGLALEVSVDPDTPHILFGDEIRIKQIALNLLTNAVKYTDEGKVSINVGFKKESEDEITLSFVISDTGIGMKEEDMDKLFSPFRRIELERNRNIEGTGLGMSIVRQLLSLMDSRLEVDSKYGEGSKFSFDIKQKVIKWDPVGDVGMRFSQDAEETYGYTELFHAPDAHILVVDDTEVNLEVIKNLLKQTKVNIDIAPSGKMAIALAGKNHYDVIFIDHMMPEMDGIETLARLKEEHPDADTVYVALTANAVSGARQMYLDKGFVDYLSKPVDGKRLEDMLKTYLPKDKIVPVEASSPVDTGERVYNDKKILVVDDDEVIIAAAENILGGAFTVVSCQEGAKALSVAKTEMPALILLDINLGGMNGFEVLQSLNNDPVLCEIPVMFITADEDREKEVLGLKNGAADFIRKPFIPEVLLQRSMSVISLDKLRKDLKGEVRRQSRRADRLTKEMMVALSHTVDAKDHYTNGHSERVATYAAEIARRMGKSPDEQKMLFEIGLLHDIGKIGIPEEIINKTARLTDEEFATIKKHTEIGCEILKGISDMPELCMGARSHHEKYNGTGYPDGLSADAIPEVARIICVADCYDAMTSTRTYSEPKAQDVVRAEIVRCSGTQFDPVIADVMLSMIDDDKDFVMNEKRGATDVWKGIGRFWDIDDDIHGDGDHAAVKDDTAGIPNELYDVEGIDVKSGIANCGSEDSLLSVLSVFHRTAKNKAEEIRKFFTEGDIANYTIKVHALKSAARIIGASQLSDMARELELAGKRGDGDYIKENTDDLLDKYIEIYRALSFMDSNSEDLPELSSDMRAEAFQTLVEVASAMDYGMTESVLKNLRAYKLTEEDDTIVKDMEDKLMQLDFDGIVQLAKKG